MAKKYSEKSAVHPLSSRTTGARTPQVFVVSSDRAYARLVLSTCARAPLESSYHADMDSLGRTLAEREALSVAFVLLIEKSPERIDPLALRACKLDYPQINYLVILGACGQPWLLRLQAMGVQNIILPPYDAVDLTGEIETALPNLPQFKRNPDLMKRGLLRLDFSIPSDLGYVLGLNHMIAMLLKEFQFPTPDCRINIPLACDEALTNAIIHGNRQNRDKKVHIQIYVSAARFKMRIEDQGEGFDLNDVDNPTEGEAVLRPGGRGVYLMRRIMDSVVYRDGGRVVELEKQNQGGSTKP